MLAILYNIRIDLHFCTLAWEFSQTNLGGAINFIASTFGKVKRFESAFAILQPQAKQLWLTLLKIQVNGRMASGLHRMYV